MPIPLQPSVVYGPIYSRRLNTSLGINILPTDRKYCFSNCLYCQYGFTDFLSLSQRKLSSIDFLIKRIEQGFEEHKKKGLKPHSITFSGNGEPTVHPELFFIVKEVKNLRDIYFPQTPISILSDSSRVHFKSVQKALSQFDLCYMKLDSGDDEMMKVINDSRFQVPWNKKLTGLKEISNLAIQSMFFSTPVNNASEEQVELWLNKLEQVAPSEAHLYTIDRSPAHEKATAVSKQTLNKIAKSVKKRMGGVDVKVFK